MMRVSPLSLASLRDRVTELVFREGTEDAGEAMTRGEGRAYAGRHQATTLPGIPKEVGERRLSDESSAGAGKAVNRHMHATPSRC